MEATSTTQQGATHNTETGKTQVPNNQGGVSEETRREYAAKYPNAVLMSDEVYKKMVESIGAQEQDAASRGHTYKPSMGQRFTAVTKKNLTILDLFIAVAVTGGVVWVARKGGQILARKMGWNLFGNVVLLDQTEETTRRVQIPRPPRNAPSAPMATA